MKIIYVWSKEVLYVYVVVFFIIVWIDWIKKKIFINFIVVLNKFFFVIFKVIISNDEDGL